MVTTEIVSLSISAGNEKIGEPDNNGAKVMSQTAQTLLSAPGCRRVYFGTAVEDAQTVRMLIDWDEHASQKAFVASSAYNQFLGTIKTIVTAKPAIVHIDLDDQAEYDKAVAAPITEIVAFYFDGEVPADYGTGISKVQAGFSAVPGFRAFSWGKTHETDIEYEGVQGQSAVCVIGWDSVEAHIAMRRTPVFEECAPYLRSTSKRAKMQHIAAMRVHKE